MQNPWQGARNVSFGAVGNDDDSSGQDGCKTRETGKQKKTNVSKMMIFYLKGNLTMKIFIFHIFEHKDIRIWHYRWKLAKGDDVKR